MAATLLLGLTAGCKPQGESSSSGTGGDGTKTSEPGAVARKAPTAAPVKVTGDVIKIGLVASQTGQLRPWGADSINGAQLAVDEVNAAGGINGKKVQLLVQDSASKPETGKSAAEKLVADGAIGMLGEVASGITMLMAKVAFEHDIPVVAIGATKVELTDEGSNIFRVCYTDKFQGPVMAKFAFEDLGLKKVAIVTDKQTPYSKGLSDNFRKKFEAMGGTIVTEQFYDTGAQQFTGQITEIKAKSPDGIFLSGYFPEVAPFVRQAKSMGMNAKYFGGDGWDTTELVANGGEAIVGGYFCNHYNNDEDRAEVKGFLKKWGAKYGKPPATAMGALSYDAAMLMMDGLKRAKSLDSKALIDAIEDTTDFAGVSGKITLKGKHGDPPKRALIVRVGSDKQEFVKAYEFDAVMK